MRIMLALLVFLMLPGVAMSARWKKDTIPVWYYGSDRWQPYVQASIEDFNANLPPRVPGLIFIDTDEVSCSQLPQSGRSGGLSVCTSQLGRWQGKTTIHIRHGEIIHGLIQLDDSTPPFDVYMAGVVCHELTHAVLDTPDNSHQHVGLDESCVQGTLTHLGPWDIRWAKRMYRR